MSTVVVKSQESPGCLIQLLWFFFVGAWLGQAWVVIAWVLMVTIVGIPVAVKMLNALPQIVALRGQGQPLTVRTVGNNLQILPGSPQQAPLLLRALYFLLIGWWFSAIWMEAAFLLCATVVGLPLGFWMFDRVPAIVSLHR
ncbi:MAG: YccF domain-containing protein [Chloroflexi bacterium]|nr:YccF domain-containing protein [Chloroflexota bacterium]